MSDDSAQRTTTWWQNFLDKMFPVIVGGLLAIAGSYFATTVQISAQAKLQKSEDQRKVFARFMGRKLVTQQLAVSRIEARMFQTITKKFGGARVLRRTLSPCKKPSVGFTRVKTLVSR
jgi:hypothetical protein